MQRETVRVVKRKKPFSVDNVEFEEKRKNRLPRPPAYTLSDEVAGGQFHYKNYLVTQLKAAFPEKHQLWHVDKMYAYAEPGILFVDEPRTAEEIDYCTIKKEAMKEAGLRYIAINPQMDITDCIMELEGNV